MTRPRHAQAKPRTPGGDPRPPDEHANSSPNGCGHRINPPFRQLLSKTARVRVTASRLWHDRAISCSKRMLLRSLGRAMQQFSPYTTRPHTHSRIFWQLLADIPPKTTRQRRHKRPTDFRASRPANRPLADEPVSWRLPFCKPHAFNGDGNRAFRSEPGSKRHRSGSANGTG